MSYPGDPHQPPNSGWQPPLSGGGYPGYGPPLTPPPKKSKAGLVVLVVVLVGIFLFATGTAVYVLIPGQESANAQPSSAPEAPSDSPATPSPTPTGPEPSATKPAAKLPEEFDGQWSGEVTQHSPDGSELLSWDLTLNLKGGSGTADAELSLPGGDCTWDMMATDASASQAELSWEVMSDPERVCADNGDITLVRADDGNSIDVRMETEFSEGTSWAEGTLKRGDD